MRNPAKNETASPNVEAIIAAKHAASMLCGAKYQNSITAEKIVSTCSTASLHEVESDSSTAKKYPFMHVHCDINGSPQRQNAQRRRRARRCPKICAAAKSEKHSSKTAMVQLTVRQNKKHCVTTLRTVQRVVRRNGCRHHARHGQADAEVESVMASRNTEKMSW